MCRTRQLFCGSTRGVKFKCQVGVSVLGGETQAPKRPSARCLQAQAQHSCGLVVICSAGSLVVLGALTPLLFTAFTSHTIPIYN